MSPRMRSRVERLVEQLLELLDLADGDPDLEPDLDLADLDSLSMVEEPARWRKVAA